MEDIPGVWPGVEGWAAIIKSSHLKLHEGPQRLIGCYEELGPDNLSVDDRRGNEGCSCAVGDDD